MTDEKTDISNTHIRTNFILYTFYTNLFIFKKLSVFITVSVPCFPQL